MNIDKLIKMANQIVLNMEYGGDTGKAVDGAADHMRRFWTPDMLAEIIEYAEGGGSSLSETAAKTVAKLAEEQKNAA